MQDVVAMAICKVKDDDDLLAGVIALGKDQNKQVANVIVTVRPACNKAGDDPICCRRLCW